MITTIEDFNLWLKCSSKLFKVEESAINDVIEVDVQFFFDNF